MRKIDQHISDLEDSIYHWYDLACQTFFYDDDMYYFSPNATSDDCACCLECDSECPDCAILAHHPAGPRASCLEFGSPYDLYTEYKSKKSCFNQAIKMINLLQIAHANALARRNKEKIPYTKKSGEKWQW